MKTTTHRDEIHGDTDYDEIATALLNTSSLQRLGRVYQLGFSHLVFRTGNHTRLSHSMGCMTTARRLVGILQRNYTSEPRPDGVVDPTVFLPCPSLTMEHRWEALRYIVSWAALLHDIGHVPLGHTLEDEFSGVYQRHDSLLSPRMSCLWYEESDGSESEIRQVFSKLAVPRPFEDAHITGNQLWQAVMSVCLSKNTKGRAFSEELAEAESDPAAQASPTTLAFINILREAEAAATRKHLFHAYMVDIVANTISADYLDYLRRDAQNLGLDTVADDRVISMFWIGKDGLQRLRMALPLRDRRGKIRRDTHTGVTELVRQRYRLAEIVYYHKTKVAASVMLARALELLEAPAEVRAQRQLVLDVESSIARSRTLMQLPHAERMAAVDKLSAQLRPEALLDPELGDESLLLFLAERGVESLTTGAKAGDEAAMQRSLGGLALVQAIVRRKLYKVAAIIDERMYNKLARSGCSLEKFIDKYRGSKEKQRKRGEVEHRMVKHADLWPESILLYVPPIKLHAKGVETCVLDERSGHRDKHVLAFDEHDDLKEVANRLRDKYRGLWKLMLFVHPGVASRCIELSHALDSFIESEFGIADVGSKHDELRELAWFSYIPSSRRKAATKYRDNVDALCRGNARNHSVDYDLLLSFERCYQTTIGDDELSWMGTLAHVVEPESPSKATRRITEKFPRVGDLGEALRGQVLQEAYSKDGEGGTSTDLARLIALGETLRGPTQGELDV